MKKTIISILIAAAAFSFIWFRKTTQIKPLEEVLIVGTSADFPPFSFRDENNEIVGFDIDVIKEVTKRLNMKIDLQDKPFGTLLPQLQLGQIHIIAAGMTATEERKKNVNFSKPYLTGNQLLVINLAQKYPAINSFEELKGKEVIVNTGYTSDIYMSKFPEINLVRLPKVTDALAALEQDKAFAYVTSDLSLKPYLKELQDKNKYNIFKINETDENTALAVAKSLPEEFLNKINNILDSMQVDGTLDALKLKWKVV